MARVSQLSATGRITSPCGTTAGRLRVLRGLSWVGSESAISARPFLTGVRVGDTELCKNFYFQSLHGLGRIVCLVVIADQMQETVDGQMAEMMIKRLLLVVGFPARRLI